MPEPRRRARRTGTTSRRASIGETRVADHAGSDAATMVTTRPTARATSTVRVSTAGEVVGISMPISFEQRPDADGQPDADQQASAPDTSPIAAGLEEDAR